MWQDLFSQIDVIWMVLVLVSTACLLALTLVYFFLLRRMMRSHLEQYRQLRKAMTTFDGCQIDHLPRSVQFVHNKMNPEFATAFDRLAVDSTAMYRDVWIPDPASRLPFDDVWPQRLRQLYDQPIQSAVLLGGIAVTTLTWSTGLALYGDTFNLIGLRLIAFTPVLVCALLFLWIRQMREVWLYQLRSQWQQTMIALERHLPAFNQAAETAVLLHEIKDYDLRMAESSQELTDQVRRLASGQLTESISSAIKYIMSANIAPSIMKSSDALSLLAREIEKRLRDSELMIGRLCTELESRQDRQADLWLQRYQDLATHLETHQTAYLAQMEETISQLNTQISQTQEKMLGNLTQTQTDLLSQLVEQQQQIIAQIKTDSQQVWQVLQDQLSSTLTGLTEGQNQLMTQVRQTDEAQAAALSQRHELAMGQISQQLELLTGRLATTQDEVWQAMREHQEAVSKTLLGQQEQVAQTLLSQQENAFGELSQKQSDAYSQATALQREGLTHLSERHEALIQQLDQHQNDAIRTIDQRQMTSLEDFRQHQEDVALSMSERQQTALDQLADRFAGEISQTLADQLDPVSTRLQQSAEILVAAQSYAESVRETLHSQHEQSSALQETIRDLYQQLKDTHQGLNTDLSSLRQSSGTMSEAAETMSQVYAGSQSGLSQSIEQMSGDMALLSETLRTIMAGSAEQTQLMQSQSNEIYETNQKHLEAVREQIDHLSNELATRIDQLMIGFGNMTEQLMQQVTGVVNEQNESLGGSLRSLSETMGDEARSMSLFAQQINMEIEELSGTLGKSVTEFDSGIREELSSVLSQFDTEVTDIVKRLARVATELGDAVESLPEAIRHIQK